MSVARITGLLPARIRAHNNFGVGRTPTFFVNGKRMDGATMADFDRVLTPPAKR